MVYWDSELPGFGVRVYPSRQQGVHRPDAGEGEVQAGHGGPPRGDHGGAGAPARGVDHHPREGGRGSRLRRPLAPKPPPGPAVAEIAERYLAEHVALRCKPTTAAQRRFVLEKHILPAFGAMSFEDVTRERVTALHHGLRATPATANTVLATLSRMFTFAEACGLGTDGGNPCRFVVEVQGAPARALSERRRVRAPWNGTGGDGGGGAAFGSCCRRVPASDADGVPAQRDRDAALVRRGPRRRRAASRSGQDRGTHGDAVARGGAGSRRPAARGGHPMGDRGSPAGDADHQPQRAVAADKGAGGPGGRQASRPAAQLGVSRALALGESLPMIGRLLGHAKGGDDRKVRPSRPGTRCTRRRRRSPPTSGQTCWVARLPGMPTRPVPRTGKVRRNTLCLLYDAGNASAVEGGVTHDHDR